MNKINAYIGRNLIFRNRYFVLSLKHFVVRKEQKVPRVRQVRFFWSPPRMCGQWLTRQLVSTIHTGLSPSSLL